MTKEEELFQKRLEDLANRTALKEIRQFSDFLNLNELNIFHHTIQKFSYVGWKTFGGYEDAERQMVAFFPDAFSLPDQEEIKEQFPIVCIHISPLNEKFADELSHRDFLGAILNLGIDRSKIGDICLNGQHAYVFCTQKMGEFLCKELTRVSHTAVLAKEDCFPETELKSRTENIKGSIASVRLDALLALAFQGSRSSLTSLIETGRIFVNGRLVTSNGYNVKEEDLISARGFGRFRYKGMVSHTKKGRCFVEIEKFI